MASKDSHQKIGMAEAPRRMKRMEVSHEPHPKKIKTIGIYIAPSITVRLGGAPLRMARSHTTTMGDLLKLEIKNTQISQSQTESLQRPILT